MVVSALMLRRMGLRSIRSTSPAAPEGPITFCQRDHLGVSRNHYNSSPLQEMPWLSPAKT
jgi:hypothetical protein